MKKKDSEYGREFINYTLAIMNEKDDEYQPDLLTLLISLMETDNKTNVNQVFIIKIIYYYILLSI